MLVVSVLLPGALPAAAKPVIVEVQLPSDTVTMLLWDRLYTEEICVLDPFPFPGPGDPLAVVDRVTFPEQPQVVNPGSGANIVIRADVFLRSERCLSRPCGATNYFTWDSVRRADPLELELTYALDLTTDAQANPNSPTATLCLSLVNLHDIEGGLDVPPGVLPTALRDALEGFGCPSFSLKSLKRNVLGKNSTITRAGISASISGARIGMRFEIDGPSSDSAISWDRFFQGYLGPSDNSLDWTLFIDPRLLENKVRTQIDEELTCKENARLPQCHKDFDDDGVECDQDTDDARCDETSAFHRTSGPSAVWSGGGAYGGGHLYIELAGEIPGGFSETPCPNAIHVDPVEIDVDLRIDAADPGWMKSRIVIDPDPDDDDVLECAFFLGSLPGPISSVLTLIILPIVADCFDPSASQVGLDDSCDDITAPSCLRHCTQLDDDEYECADRLNFGDPLDVGGPTIGEFHLTHMIGTTQGAVLGGALDREVRPPLFGPPPLPPFPQVPRQKLIVRNGLIAEGVQGGCSNLHWGYSGSFEVLGDGELCHPMQVLNDPPTRHANQVPIYGLIWPGADPHGPDYLGQQTVGIRFPATSSQSAIDGFFADPYAFEVLVRSSAGLQNYRIAAPAPPNDAKRIELLSKAFLNCEARSFGFRLPSRALNFLWLPDPPPFEIQLQAAYTVHPPPGETHHAYLAELTARPVHVVAAAADPTGLPGMIFPDTQLLFEGKIHFDMGSFGQFVTPFSLPFEQDLRVTDLYDTFAATVIMSSSSYFAIKTLSPNLPPGVSTANAFFTVGPDTVLLDTTLLQVAGPADFDESGDVALTDWNRMRRGLVVPGGRTPDFMTDFDTDGDSDLRDSAAFQNWFTGVR